MYRDRVAQVFFEDSSVMEQIRYMRRVDVLVGVTGSGLTNLAFMRPGSILVELMSPFGTPNYFASLIMRVHGLTSTLALHLAPKTLPLLTKQARARRARPRSDHVQAHLLRAHQLGKYSVES